MKRCPGVTDKLKYVFLPENDLNPLRFISGFIYLIFPFFFRRSSVEVYVIFFLNLFIHLFSSSSFATDGLRLANGMALRRRLHQFEIENKRRNSVGAHRRRWRPVERVGASRVLLR